MENGNLKQALHDECTSVEKTKERIAGYEKVAKMATVATGVGLVVILAIVMSI